MKMISVMILALLNLPLHLRKACQFLEKYHKILVYNRLKILIRNFVSDYWCSQALLIPDRGQVLSHFRDTLPSHPPHKRRQQIHLMPNR